MEQVAFEWKGRTVYVDADKVLVIPTFEDHPEIKIVEASALPEEE